MGLGWSISFIFSVIFRGWTGWTLGNSLALYCTSLLHFWLRKDQGFAALVGILVALSFLWCFPLVICKSIDVDVCHFPSFASETK